jgi:hypothetical protein
LGFNHRTQQDDKKLHNSFEGPIREVIRLKSRLLKSPFSRWRDGVSSGDLEPNVSFDALQIVDIAFTPQIRVRWLSGRKRRFAKALYPKRVPRVRIPASPRLSEPFPAHFEGIMEKRVSLLKANLGED